LAFQAGMRGKGGGEVRDAKFTVKVSTPEGKEVDVRLARADGENQGTFGGTQAAGVYRVTVRGEGRDAGGGAISGEAVAWAVVYDEDAEAKWPAADDAFMRKVAAAGGGEANRIEELPQFLLKLAERPLQSGRQEVTRRPNWQTKERSSFLMLFFTA